MATNFFEQQAAARRATGHLVALYIMAVMAIVGAVALLVHVVFGIAPSDATDFSQVEPNWNYAIAAALGTFFVIMLGMLYRMSQLGSNGVQVAELLGGVRVSPSTQNAQEKRLLNVVEEMAIASGIPVPPVYLLSGEDSINAFAAGTRPTEAVIGVTRGTLEKLNRDELQGVIAHEFSHIFNGDMRLNLRLMGVLGGILAISTIGRVFLELAPRRRSGSGKNKDPLAALIVIALGLVVIGSIGVFFARLIKAAVSRQREYLADASALQYTRNPLGIGGALKKIMAHSQHALIKSSYAEEASHLFFGSALKFSSLFATHPPLEERISRIHPQLLKDDSVFKAAPQAKASSIAAGEGVMALTAREVMSSIGGPTANDVAAASAFLKSLPEVAHEASRTAEGAKAVIAALFLTNEDSQGTAFLTFGGETLFTYAQEMKRQLSTLNTGYRLPVLELALPALRDLDHTERHGFLTLCHELIWADKTLDLFEFAAFTLLKRQLRDTFERAARPKTKARHLSAVANEASILLSAFAHTSAPTPEAAAELFRNVTHAAAEIRLQVSLRPAAMCGPEALLPALEALGGLLPFDQKRLLEMCVGIVLHDSKTTPSELELLRAVSIALEAPIPATAGLQ